MALERFIKHTWIVEGNFVCSHGIGNPGSFMIAYFPVRQTSTICSAIVLNKTLQFTWLEN